MWRAVINWFSKQLRLWYQDGIDDVNNAVGAVDVCRNNCDTVYGHAGGRADIERLPFDSGGLQLLARNEKDNRPAAASY